MPNPQAKRIVLIEPRFQLRLVLEFVLLQALLSGLFAAVLYVFLGSELRAGLASAHASYRSTAQMLMPIVLVMALFNVAVATVLAASYVVRLSHRIARPLLRVRAALEELALRRIYVHTGVLPGDQLFELSQSLRGGLEVLRTDMHGLQAAVRELKRARGAGDDAGVDAAVAALDRTLGAWAPEVTEK